MTDMDATNHFFPLFTNAREAISIIAFDQWEIIDINPAFSRLLGVPKEAIIGRRLMDISVPEERESLVSMLSLADTEGFRDFYETTVLHSEGRHIPIELVFADPFEYEGRILTAGFVRDISARRMIERSLQESEHRFHRLLADVPYVAVQGYAPDGTVQYWNQASERIYGYTQEEAMGHNLLDLIIPDEMRGEVSQAMEQMSETGEPIPSAELSLRCSDGSRALVYSSHAVVRVPGRTPEIFCIDVDLSERAKSEEALRQAKDRAEAASLLKSQFLANMSHEIRTPMNGVLGMLQLLQDTRLSEEQSQYVNLSISSAGMLMNLLNDVLDYSLIETGNIEIERVPVDIHSLLQKTKEAFEPLAARKNLAFTLHIDSCLLPDMVGDSARLRQILCNLLDNAVKFTSAGRIDLFAHACGSAGVDPDRIVFTVTDTGIGIPKGKIPELFQRFSQLDGSTTRKYGGSGLGLVISRSLAELMGGDIRVESEEGVGSKFTFECPLHVVKA